MKILWHSSAPWASTGYGRCTEEIATRINETHHDVVIQSKREVMTSKITYHGEELDRELEEPIEIYPCGEKSSNNPFGMAKVRENFQKSEADFYFTHFDTWMEPIKDIVPNLDIPFGSYTIVDHHPLPKKVQEQIKGAEEVVAMSKMARGQFQRNGIDCTYIPHGVDTDTFKPLPDDKGVEITIERGDGETEFVDPSSRFVIGIVAANFGDRKRIPIMMEAFNMFREEYRPNALLFVHTELNSSDGYNLEEIRKNVGIPSENITSTHPDDYYNVGDEYLRKWYDTMDVLLNTSMGESWGLTITEAMATGTPAIVTANTSMLEQVGVDISRQPRVHQQATNEYSKRGGFIVGDNGIAVQPSVDIWREKTSAKQSIVEPTDIVAALSYYVKNPDQLKEHSENAREKACNEYDWEEHVVPKFVETFDQIEEKLDGGE